jgi:predicted nuclease of restriction endonuclease-like (RecB) superfamily
MGRALQLSVHTHAAAVRSLSGRSKQAATCDHQKTGTREAREEIQTYVAIRDLLLSDAEVTTTPESLRRATIANEFAETCLQAARSPYEAQFLETHQAARELERCCAAKMRIATLHQKLSLGMDSNWRSASEFDVM